MDAKMMEFLLDDERRWHNVASDPKGTGDLRVSSSVMRDLLSRLAALRERVAGMQGGIEAAAKIVEAEIWTGPRDSDVHEEVENRNSICRTMAESIRALAARKEPNASAK